MLSLDNAIISKNRLESKRVFELQFRHEGFGQTSVSMIPGITPKIDKDIYSLYCSVVNLKNGGYGMKISLPIEFNIRDNDLVIYTYLIFF